MQARRSNPDGWHTCHGCAGACPGRELVVALTAAR
jgi:hypothetical protein